MGDRDQRLGALAQALSEELGDAPLGHDRADVGAGRDDAGALAQGIDDPRGRSPGGGRRQRDDGIGPRPPVPRRG